MGAFFLANPLLTSFLTRFLAVGVTYAVAKGYIPQAAQGPITDLIVIGMASMSGLPFNTVSAVRESAANSGAIVVAPAQDAAATPNPNVISPREAAERFRIP